MVGILTGFLALGGRAVELLGGAEFRNKLIWRI
jgi:hypothetical protein